MKKSFSLLELLVTLVIVLILATFAAVGYRQLIDNTRQKVCAVNQAVILGGIQYYFMSTGVSPATLGDIRPQDLRKAYLEVMKDADWRTKFSYFFVKLNRPRNAYAQIDNVEDLMNWEKMEACGIPFNVFECPADDTPPPLGVSYGICSEIKDYTKWGLVPGDQVLVGDCESLTFPTENQLEDRHWQRFSTQKISQGITKHKKIKKLKK